MKAQFAVAILVLLGLLVGATSYVGYQLRESNKLVASIQGEVDALLIPYPPNPSRRFIPTSVLGTIDVQGDVNVTGEVDVGRVRSVVEVEIQ